MGRPKAEPIAPPSMMDAVQEQMGTFAIALAKGNWPACRIAVRAIGRLLPDSKPITAWAPYLRLSVQELEDQAAAAQPGSVAAVTAKRLAIETRNKLRETELPKESPAPTGTRMELLKYQRDRMLAEGPALKARDAQAWIRLQTEIRILSAEIAALEAAAGPQTPEEIEAGLVEVLAGFAPARRQRVLGMLEQRVGVRAQGRNE